MLSSRRLVDVIRRYERRSFRWNVCVVVVIVVQSDVLMRTPTTGLPSDVSLKWRSTVTCDVWKCTTLVIPEVMNSKFGWSESSCHRTRAYHAPRDKHIWNFFVLPSLIRHGKDFAPPSTPGFSDKVGLNLALCLVTSCSRLHDWYLHAVGWDEGQRALVAPLEDTGVEWGFIKNILPRDQWHFMSSEHRDQMARLCIKYLAIYSNESLSSSIRNFPK